MYVLFFVGGFWVETTYCGLWFWSFFESSSQVYFTFGARPLIIGIWCVLYYFRVYFFTLVGGRWLNGASAGLWYWNFNWVSTDYSTNVGARQLIFIIYLHIIFLAPWQKLVALGWLSRFILEKSADKYKNYYGARL